MTDPPTARRGDVQRGRRERDPAAAYGRRRRRVDDCGYQGAQSASIASLAEMFEMAMRWLRWLR